MNYDYEKIKVEACQANARLIAHCVNHFDTAIGALNTIGDIADSEWNDTESVTDIINEIRAIAQDTVAELKGLFPPEEAEVVPDDKVKLIWGCQEEDCSEGNPKYGYSPKWHEENGTPVCGCGVDMKYIRTEILK